MIPDGLCLQYESQSSFGSIYKTRIEGNNMFCDYYNPSSRTYCKRLRVLCPEHSKDPKVNDTEVCIIEICEWMNGLLQGWIKHVVHMNALVVSCTVIVMVAKVSLKLKRQLFFLFLRSCDCIVTNFFIIKPTRCTNFTNLFCHETLHVLDNSSVHHQDQDGASWSCLKAVYEPVWHIQLLSVRWINSWWSTEELSKTCRVSGQNKYVKLVHLGGCITKKFEEAV